MNLVLGCFGGRSSLGRVDLISSVLKRRWSQLVMSSSLAELWSLVRNFLDLSR